ncbi:DUF2304 domain-containing protein [Actinocorallia longicatena]|uniref:DUF2304 domain-containing protein n=1 Tax=Actinocorallia longicatena TaxID=111803 RepID=A0ABP6QG00_9ACTN
MTVYTLGLVGAVVTLGVIFEMLRRRKLREKYAVFWVLLSVLIAAVAVYPPLLERAARMAGVEVPANLLFFVASLVLLAVNVQLSSEVGRLEERVRTLAEELGLQRLTLERQVRTGRRAHDESSGDKSPDDRYTAGMEDPDAWETEELDRPGIDRPLEGYGPGTWDEAG